MRQRRGLGRLGDRSEVAFEVLPELTVPGVVAQLSGERAQGRKAGRQRAVPAPVQVGVRLLLSHVPDGAGIPGEFPGGGLGREHLGHVPGARRELAAHPRLVRGWHDRDGAEEILGRGVAGELVGEILGGVALE